MVVSFVNSIFVITFSIIYKFKKKNLTKLLKSFLLLENKLNKKKPQILIQFYEIIQKVDLNGHTTKFINRNEHIFV